MLKQRVGDFQIRYNKVSELLDRQSVTIAIQDKAGLIQAMLSLKQQYPDIKLPLTSTSLPIRGAQQEVM